VVYLLVKDGILMVCDALNLLKNDQPILEDKSPDRSSSMTPSKGKFGSGFNKHQITKSMQIKK